MKRNGLKSKEQGSMMMEAVMVMPLLAFLIFFIIQLALVLLSKQMTYYAAYCGARAAMVYNPADYAAEQHGGIVHRAACTALSWISQSVKGSRPIMIPTNEGDYAVPRSEDIDDQVEVKIQEGSAELNDMPLVTVTVVFHCPLLIPLGGREMAFISGNAYTVDKYGWHSMSVQESCTLAKPYKTETFPLIPPEDRRVLNLDKAEE